MSDSNGKESETGPSKKVVEIKEAFWFVVTACIGLILLILLHQSGDVMGNFTQSGKKTIPTSFWILATIYLVASISVFPLLKDSKPVEFKVLGCLLTGVVPIVTLLLVVYNLLKLGN